MKQRLIVKPAAEVDIADGRDFYNGRRKGLGTRFVLAVRNAVRHIRTFPVVGTEVYRGVRRVVVRGFPYVVLYLVESDCVTVIAVYHTSRDPEGWHERIT